VLKDLGLNPMFFVDGGVIFTMLQTSEMSPEFLGFNVSPRVFPRQQSHSEAAIRYGVFLRNADVDTIALYAQHRDFLPKIPHGEGTPPVYRIRIGSVDN
jgi:hypothetical protein